MQITLVDARHLGVVIVRQPGYNQFWNPQTTGWDHLFDPTHHEIAFGPLVVGPPLFAPAQTAAIGRVLLDGPGAAALIMTIDPPTAAPLAVVDCWTLPSPMPYPAAGGFVRS